MVIETRSGEALWLPTGWLAWAVHAVFPKKPSDVAAAAAANGEGQGDESFESLPDSLAFTVVIPTITADDVALADKSVHLACETSARREFDVAEAGAMHSVQLARFVVCCSSRPCTASFAALPAPSSH